MTTITLPKTKYEVLKKKASLYEEIFRFLSKSIFGIESYSEERIKEFLKEDKLEKKAKERLERLLKSL